MSTPPKKTSVLNPLALPYSPTQRRSSPSVPGISLDPAESVCPAAPPYSPNTPGLTPSIPPSSLDPVSPVSPLEPNRTSLQSPKAPTGFSLKPEPPPKPEFGSLSGPARSRVEEGLTAGSGKHVYAKPYVFDEEEEMIRSEGKEVVKDGSMEGGKVLVRVRGPTMPSLYTHDQNKENKKNEEMAEEEEL